MFGVQQKWIEQAAKRSRVLRVGIPLGNAQSQPCLFGARSKIECAQIPLEVQPQIEELDNEWLNGFEQRLNQAPQDLTFAQYIAAKPEPQPREKTLPRRPVMLIVGVFSDTNNG